MSDSERTEGHPKLVQIDTPRLRHKKRVDVLFQEDFAELIIYARDAKEARRRWQDKIAYIKDALQNGARVEPGIHSGSVNTVTRLTVH